MQYFLEVANILADLSRIEADKYFRNISDINIKEDIYPVTKADLAIEESIRNYLLKNLPSHGVYGEEFSLKTPESEYMWVIDPIDGTAGFSCGKPLYTTLIALLKNNEVVLAVVDQAFTKERWVSVLGGDTLYNGKKCLSSKEDSLNKSRISCTTPFMFYGDEKKIFEKIFSKAKVKTFGGDAYAYCLLAMGHIDVILEADLKFYDVAAVKLIIENSGSVISDWEGNKLNYNSFKGQALACSSVKLQKEILNIINAYNCNSIVQISNF